MQQEQRERFSTDSVQPDGEIFDQVLLATEATLDKREAAFLEMQLSTSAKRPRSVKRFLDYATQLATADQETAADCSYSVPRGGKKMEGPSIRLAEICALAWGNLQSEVRVVDIGEKFVTAGASVWDMETNNRISEEQPRSIMGSARNGPAKRYNDDMIIVTMKAAMSIALRNAIFRIVPRALVEQIREKCKAVVRGDEKTLGSRRKSLIDYFATQGISQARVCAAVGRPGVDDIGLDDIVTLRGLATAIKDGAATIAECFPDTTKDTRSLADKIKGLNGTAHEKPATPTAAEAPPEEEPPQEQHQEPQAEQQPEPQTDESEHKALVAQLANALTAAKLDQKTITAPCGKKRLTELSKSQLEWGLEEVAKRTKKAAPVEREPGEEG